MYSNAANSLLRRLTGGLPTYVLPSPPAWARWEWAVLLVLPSLALGLGLANLDGPSLWHDELVHVYVAKSIAATGWPSLPSGNFYPSSTVYNILLAVFVKLFGDGTFLVRLPSVLLSGVNVVVVYLITRAWLGRNVALATALTLALSPWHVAWARQARLYEFQLFVYLFFLVASWRWLQVRRPPRARTWGVVAVVSYVVGIFTSFHSILFLGPVGGFALLCAFYDRQWKSRYGTTILACFILGILSILWFRFNPNPVDRAAVFETGLGGTLLDYLRTDRYFYFRFLNNNLSRGFMALFGLGTLVLLAARDRRGLYVTLAFWVPVLILTFFVGYRRPRFMYFAYPVYVMLSSVGLVGLLQLIAHYRRNWIHGAAAVLALVFLGRLAVSAAALTADSIEAASGAHTTLAIRHPQWKKPTAWVKEH